MDIPEKGNCGGGGGGGGHYFSRMVRRCSSSHDESNYNNGRCSSSHDESNYNNGPLSDDLVVEILSRLPPRPLLRCKQVSKAWYKLISEVCVPKLSLQLPLMGILLLIKHRGRRPLYYRELPLYYRLPDIHRIPKEINGDDLSTCYMGCLPPRWQPPSGAVDVEPPRWHLPFVPTEEDLVDSSNGLYLYIDRAENQYWLWNPTTMQCMFIPTFGDSKSSHNAALAFDPCSSVHYKIVRFRPSPSLGSDRSVDIFYSETGTWVQHNLQYPPFALHASKVRRFIYLNGVLYRLSLSGHILRYNLEEHVNVTVFELPIARPGTQDEIGCIGLCKGHLNYARCENSTLLIWMLRERCDGNEWVLKSSTNLNELARRQHFRQFKNTYPSPSDIRLLTFHPASDAIFLWTPAVIIIYSHNTNKLEAIYCNLPWSPSILRRAPSHVYPILRCLVTLKEVGHSNRNKQEMLRLGDPSYLSWNRNPAGH